MADGKRLFIFVSGPKGYVADTVIDYFYKH